MEKSADRRIMKWRMIKAVALLKIIFPLISGICFAKERKGHRDISIIVTDEGYYPKGISVFEGETVRFYVTSTTNKKACMIVGDHELFLPANRGLVSEGQISFGRSGRFEFYCPSWTHKGRIQVLPRRQKNLKRKIAAEAQRTRRFWMPKDR